MAHGLIAAGAGFGAPAVRAGRSGCLLNPSHDHFDILGSVWPARPRLQGNPFVAPSPSPLPHPMGERGG